MALPVASVVPLAVAVTTPRGRWRYVAAGAAYMWLFKVTWELPYDDPERLKRRLQVRYAVRIDRVLGGGQPPTLRLQRALRNPTRVTTLDKAVTMIYGSWFVPHLMLAWILLRHEEFVPRAAGRLAAAYHLTTPFYWLLPTAPPWWASESEGEMDGQVKRVRRQVIAELRKQPERKPGDSPGNPWGSMPSDHIASAAISAMGLSEISVVYGVLGWGYVLLAGFSVVYLGEHYLVDVLAGLALAEAIRVAEPRLTPVVRRVAQDLERFAPPTR